MLLTHSFLFPTTTIKPLILSVFLSKYSWNFFVILASILFLYPLSAQGLDEGSITKNQSTTTFQLPTIATHHKSFVLAQDPIYIPSEIDRVFYENNPFDIDDFSNPFNLPRAGSITHVNEKVVFKGTSFKDFFNNLFATYPSIQEIGTTTRVPSWLFFLLLALLALFAYLLTIYRDEVAKEFNTFLSVNTGNQNFREQTNIFSPYNVLAYVLFTLSGATFLLLSTNMFISNSATFPNWGMGYYLLLVLLLTVGYLLKFMQLLLLGAIFPIKQELQYYSFSLSNNHKIVGVGLIPLLFLVAYTPSNVQMEFLYVSLFILGLAYFFTLVRTTLVTREIILFHKFHFFIYLCSVEIAPVLIFLKLISII